MVRRLLVAFLVLVVAFGSVGCVAFHSDDTTYAKDSVRFESHILPSLTSLTIDGASDPAVVASLVAALRETYGQSGFVFSNVNGGGGESSNDAAAVLSAAFSQAGKADSSGGTLTRPSEEGGAR